MPDNRPFIKRHVAPSVPVEINLKDENYAVIETVSLRVGFNLNVLARMQARTGFPMLGLEMWSAMGANMLGVMLWAACIPYNPEYDTRHEKTGAPTDEGLLVIQSYLADQEEVDKVFEALWSAYRLHLPPNKRPLFDEMRKFIEGKARQENPSQVQPAMTESKSTGPTSGLSDDTTSASVMTKSAS